MAEGVDMPGNSGYVIEGFLEPAQTNRHIVDEILIVHVGFVGHAPSCIDELDLPIGYQILHLLLLLVCSLIPPTVEESHLNDGEFIFGVLG